MTPNIFDYPRLVSIFTTLPPHPYMGEVPYRPGPISMTIWQRRPHATDVAVMKANVL